MIVHNSILWPLAFLEREVALGAGAHSRAEAEDVGHKPRLCDAILGKMLGRIGFRIYRVWGL